VLCWCHGQISQSLRGKRTVIPLPESSGVRRAPRRGCKGYFDDQTACGEVPSGDGHTIGQGPGCKLRTGLTGTRRSIAHAYLPATISPLENKRREARRSTPTYSNSTRPAPASATTRLPSAPHLPAASGRTGSVTPPGGLARTTVGRRGLSSCSAKSRLRIWLALVFGIFVGAGIHS